MVSLNDIKKKKKNIFKGNFINKKLIKKKKRNYFFSSHLKYF
jgi:hypothetical protein